MEPRAGTTATYQHVQQAEDGIARTLTLTADELAHAECFDEEQRAEIYAILQAIKTDTETHRQAVELLAKRLSDPEGLHDA